MRGKAHSDEVKSAAIAALLTGQGVSEVARTYKLPESTVSNLKRSIPQSTLNAAKINQLEVTAENIIALLTSVKSNAIERGRRSKIRSEKQLVTKDRSYAWHSSPYVYIVHCEGSQYYKIGRSKIKPEFRLSQLQTGNPKRLRFIELIETDNAANIESYIHHKWQMRRGMGEWFMLSVDDVTRLISDVRGCNDVKSCRV